MVGAQNLSLIIALLLLVTVISLQTDKFLSPANLLNIGLAIALLGLVAIGETVVIVSGGLDVSVGSTAGLASVASALAVGATGTAIGGVAVGIIAGALAGLTNGLIITVGRVNPVIATLATFSAFKGFAFLLSNGSAVAVTDAAFNALGSGRIMGIPIPLLILIGVAIAIHLMLRTMDLGRNIYALGGSLAAARLAGVPVRRYQMGAYILSGAIAGLAGVLLTARTTSGQPASGSQGLELEAITAAFLGGCALGGGSGTIVGTMLGVIIIGTLNNGLILLNVPTFYQLVAKGVLLVVAVMISEWRLSREGRRSWIRG
jgi:ribose transport system permease protein/L-arabinose transport system permease protein